jgi:predicted acylesterase/phospholipase RssA
MDETRLETEARQALHQCKGFLNERKYGEAHRILHDFRETHLEGSHGSEVSQRLRDEHTLEHARCLYHDPEMPKDLALGEALELLHADLKLDTTLDPDVLYLAGRIHEERWDRDGQWLQLRQALNYYGNGYECAAEGTEERALNGTRAAFVLQVLARQDESAAYATSANPDFTRSVPTGEDIKGRPAYLPESAREFRDQSKAIKEDLLRELKPALEAGESVSWRYRAAAAECLFGLRRYEDAGEVLRAIAPDEPPTPASAEQDEDSIAETDLEGKDAADGATTSHEVTTSDQPDDLDLQELARRLVYLARIQGDRPEFDQAPGPRGRAAQAALTEFLRVDEDMINTIFVGKVGLALSGGGFRAALFHIGVLARLADLKILQHLEVLSCVSGGSIVGTYYYLELKELMESRPDEAITNEDYEQLVQRVSARFLEGVQRNIRGRLFNNLRVNAKMLGRYSPSQRLGDLLESEIFSLVEHNGADSSGERRRLFLRDLWIKPPGERAEFTPKHDNWRRKNKVPILVLNATSLNTGHNWQFTGSHMGEPTGIIRPDIDASPRLGRITFEKGAGLSQILDMIRNMGRREFREFMHRARKFLDANKRPIRLGDAVAASAAVPGIFEPLALDGYYSDQKGDWSVRLADGGLHDNQGVAGLVEQGCNVLFVSDASGQMSSVEAPPGGLLPALRSNLILMQRVRTAQFDELETRRRTGLVRDFMFIHLNQDLEGAVVAPKGGNRARRERRPNR